MKNLESEEKSPKSWLVEYFKHPVVRKIIIDLAVFSLIFFSFQMSLMLVLRTSNPFFAVTSNSMKHNGDSWKTYFLDQGQDPSNFPLQGGFERGDMLVVQGASAGDIVVGDVIVFHVSGGGEFTHRVVEKMEVDNSPAFRTKGDANQYSLELELSVKQNQIMGKAVFVIPKLGYISLWSSGK